MNSPDIRISGYDIHGPIGQGGMASVYLATQESLNRKVAIKVLRNSAEAGVGERFANEARFIASLNNSHVITIHDISTLDNGDCYIAMEFVGGGDLSENLGRFGDPASALGLVRQIAEGLAVVHDNGIIHRDVKPANILFREDGTAVLTDFGIAKNVDNNSDLTQAGFSLGSPSYSSPEQAQGHPLDNTTDIYSLGAVLLELLLGHNPFRGDSHTCTAINHIQLPVPKLSADLATLSPLVERMLAKKAGDRYPSCRELIEDIDRALESLDEGATPRAPSLPALAGRWRAAQFDKHRTGLMALAAAAILTALHFGFTHESETEREVRQLLEQARQSMQANRYTAPEGDNARHFYRQVLSLDSDNPTAIRGLQIVEDKQLDDYLAQGMQALEAGRLHTPEGDNALYYFRRALLVDADNARAETGMAQVTREYIRLARSAMRESDYKSAGDYIERGLGIEPDNEVLLALGTKLEQKTPSARKFIRNVFDKLREKIGSDG